MRTDEVQNIFYSADTESSAMKWTAVLRKQRHIGDSERDADR